MPGDEKGVKSGRGVDRDRDRQPGSNSAVMAGASEQADRQPV